MRNSLFAFLLLSLGILEAQTAPQAASLIWNQADPRCLLIYSNGSPHEHFELSTMIIDVFPPLTYDKHTDRVLIGIKNLSSGFIDVDPSTWQTTADDPANTVLRYTDADALLARGEKKQRRRQALAEGLSSFGAGMQTQSATVNNSEGSSSTVTYHDPSAVRASQANAARRSSETKDFYSQLADKLLRRNTLSNGGYVFGFVYFEKPKGFDKHAQIGRVNLLIAGTKYVFLFPIPKAQGIPTNPAK